MTGVVSNNIKVNSDRRANRVLETGTESPVVKSLSESKLNEQCWCGTSESDNHNELKVQHSLEIEPGGLWIKLGKIDVETLRDSGNPSTLVNENSANKILQSF